MSKQSVVASLAYKFVERLAVKGIGLVVQIILARLLAPEAFGQVAVMMVFINLSQNFIQSGFNTALVQNKDVTEIDYSTVYYITTGIALLCNIIIFFAAPFIGGFYEAPELVLPLRVFALVLFLGAFNSVQVARLQKEMRFKETMMCNLIATIISGIAGVLCAYAGLGIWALIIYNGSNVLVSAVCMAIAVKWKPQFVFSIARAKILFDFGWKMLISSFLCSLYYDMRSLIIGKRFSTADLAYYDRGQQFPVIISNTLDNAIQAVMFPALARVQDNLTKLRESLRKTIGMGVLIITPMMVGLAVVAKPLIVLLLTDKWLPAVPYMQFLCIAEISIPVISSNLIAIKAMGKSGSYMKLEIIRRIMMVVVLISAVIFFDSVLAIATSTVVIAILDTIIIMAFMNKLMDYGIAAQLKDIWRPILSSLVMGVVVYLVGMISMPTILLLAVQVFVGILAYMGASLVLNRSMVKAMLGMVRGLKGKNK